MPPRPRSATNTPALRDLLRHLEGRTGAAATDVRVGESTYRVLHAAAPEALISSEDFDHDERLPYWAELWPSAIALARHLAAQELSGTQAVELGCGVGLPTVAALERGAEVTAADHYRAALDFTAYNARSNTGREPHTAHLDWHAPEGELPGTFDLVLAADVLYEKRNVPSLAVLIPELLEPYGELLLADPRRKDTPDFLDEMERRGFQHSAESVVAVEQEEREAEVRLHRLRRA